MNDNIVLWLCIIHMMRTLWQVMHYSSMLLYDIVFIYRAYAKITAVPSQYGGGGTKTIRFDFENSLCLFNSLKCKNMGSLHCSGCKKNFVPT